MKTFKLILVLLITGLVITNCEDYDAGVDNASQLPEAVAFSKSTDMVVVAEDNPVYEIEVQSTVKSNVDRVVAISYVEAGSTNVDGDFTYESQVVIPAGSYVGYAEVVFDFSNLTLGEDRVAVFELVTNDYSINTRRLTTISYAPLCPYNELSLKLTFDQYPAETGWRLYDEGLTTVLAQGGISGNTIVGFPGQTSLTQILCLEDGNYNLVLFDSYGDGFCCAYGAGSYSLSVGGAILASGPAQFGANLIIPFSL